MKLSELQTGERGVIVKVSGHGGFRKRIVEMGFVKGKSVHVILNAPLQDPVEYEVMGYKISLRREEASLVEVVSEEEALQYASKQPAEPLHPILPSGQDDCRRIHSVHDEKDRMGRVGSAFPRRELHEGVEAGPASDVQRQMEEVAEEMHRTIYIAFVGNPNSGKTSLFNMSSGAHEHVGNYSGVTVGAKDGFFTYTAANGREYHFRVVDLPGTYSLSAYSPEEVYVRRQLINDTPDVVVNVIDSSNLERNLYLTTQLIDMNLRMVCALNIYDELQNRGDFLDYEALGTMLGVPMVPTVSRKGQGIKEMLEKIIAVYEAGGQDETLERHIHINHGQVLEQSIDRIKHIFQKTQDIRFKYSTRYLAIKFLETDKEVEQLVDTLPTHDELVAQRFRETKLIREELDDTPEEAIITAKYSFIDGALREVYRPSGNTLHPRPTVTDRIDAVVTNRWLGFPIFFALLFVMFAATFSLGQYPMDWIEWLVDRLGDFVSMNMSAGPLKDLVVDGIIGGVGAVIVFLPNILILYLFISLLEDSGYMARAAFIMDRLMHHMGLHGRSFIPLVMGFGCNVPAVMATRTIENPKSRLLTMLVVPLMSCSARIPLYVLLIGAFFQEYASVVMLGLYVLGMVLAVLVAKVFSRFLMKNEDLPFVMELPPYRIPTVKSITRHTWEKGRQYLHKMGSIILVASILIWFLDYYPRPDVAISAGKPGVAQTLSPENVPDVSAQPGERGSYLESIGRAVAPLTAPLGFDWKMNVGIFAGAGAKELVVSTLGVLYAGEDVSGREDAAAEDSRMRAAVRQSMTPAAALSYLVFILLYFPCIATVASIRSESGSWKWAIFTVAYTTLLAYAMSWLVYQGALRLL